MKNIFSWYYRNKNPKKEDSDYSVANKCTKLTQNDRENLNKEELIKMKEFEYGRYTEILRELKMKYQFKKKTITYLISCQWLNAWIDYVTGDRPYPGPIDNRTLWHLIFSKNEVKRKRDYYVIDGKIWEFLHGIYGGGPILHKEKNEVNSDTVSMRSSMTSFKGTSAGIVITETASQSDLGIISRENSFATRVGQDKDLWLNHNNSK